MAECALALIENGVFHSRQTERVRMLLNMTPHDRGDATDRRYNAIRQRVVNIEAARGVEQRGAPEPPSRVL